MRWASFQSAKAVYLPTISPKPAAIILEGAWHKVGRSAKIAMGAWHGSDSLLPLITTGATEEAKPSTEGAVGRDINTEPC